MSLHISIREFGDVTILDLRGKSTISGGESELLSGRLQELVAKGASKLLLNMADLSQVDSSVVSVIVQTNASLKRYGCGLKLPCASGRVLRVLTLHRLLE